MGPGAGSRFLEKVSGNWRRRVKGFRVQGSSYHVETLYNPDILNM